MKYFVYVHPNDDAVAHADYILELMGGCDPVNPDDFQPKDEDEDEVVVDHNPIVDSLLIKRLPQKFTKMDPKLIENKLTYTRQRCGDSENIFVPVSCSKKCSGCGGSSPGCGKNVGFDEIAEQLVLTYSNWVDLQEKSSESSNPNEYFLLHKRREERYGSIHVYDYYTFP